MENLANTIKGWKRLGTRRQQNVHLGRALSRRTPKRGSEKTNLRREDVVQGSSSPPSASLYLSQTTRTGLEVLWHISGYSPAACSCTDSLLLRPATRSSSRTLSSLQDNCLATVLTSTRDPSLLKKKWLYLILYCSAASRMVSGMW